MGKNYYKLLNVPSSATVQEIRNAYRKLALKYHPDRAGDEGAAMFIEITAAHDVLIDVHKRREYDQSMQATGSYGSTVHQPKQTVYKPYAKDSTKTIDPKHFNTDVWNYYHYGDAMPNREKMYTAAASKAAAARTQRNSSSMTDIDIENFRKSVQDEVDSKSKQRRDEDACIVS